MEFCDWCEGGAWDLVYGEDGRYRADIEEDEMQFYDNGKEVASRKINFCPICGRLLGSSFGARFIEELRKYPLGKEASYENLGSYFGTILFENVKSKFPQTIGKSNKEIAAMVKKDFMS